MLPRQTFLNKKTETMENNVENNKFHKGNSVDQKHYWLTPPSLWDKIKEKARSYFKKEVHDGCPFPFDPEKWDGLVNDYPTDKVTYLNIPFGATIHNGKKKGATAWARKMIEEQQKGATSMMAFPIDKWVLMLLASGAKVENLGDVKWLATEDGSEGKGTGRHIALFILEGNNNTDFASQQKPEIAWLSEDEIADKADFKYPDNLQQEAFRKGAKWLQSELKTRIQPSDLQKEVEQLRTALTELVNHNPMHDGYHTKRLKALEVLKNK